MTVTGTLSKTPAARARSRIGFLLAVPLALAAAAYARVLDGEFQLDDRHTIADNVAVKDLAAFVADRFVPACLHGRPVTDLTFALNYAVGRITPWNFHLTNLAIHLATVALVWAFTWRVARLSGTGRPEWLAVAAAGLFAVHPIQSEAVSYVSQRAESLASALYLAALLLILTAERCGRTWRGAAAYAGALAAFGLGLGSKLIVVTMPAAYLLLAYAVEGTPAARAELTTWRRRALLLLPFAALGSAAAVETLRGLEGSLDAGFGVRGSTPWSYFLTELRALAVYLRLLAWPAGQNVDWDFPVSHALSDPGVVGALALEASLLVAAVALVRHGRGSPGGGAARVAGFGIAWFFLVLSVTSSFVPLADVLVEHRVYLASWGVFAAAAAGVDRLVVRSRHGAIVAVAGVAVAWCALAAALHRRNAVWESVEALWADALLHSPDKPRVRLSLGYAFRTEGRYPEAIAQYAAGLDRARGDLPMEAQLLRNLCAALNFAGSFSDAARTCRLGLEKDPEDGALLLNLSVALLRSGDLEGAEDAGRRAVEAAPEDAYAWNALGGVRLAHRDYAGALAALQRGEAANPDMAEVRTNLGGAFDGLGRRAEACAAWSAALGLELGPDLRGRVEELVRSRCAH